MRVKELQRQILSEAQAMAEEIKAWRRHFHQNPELSFKEVRTTDFIEDKLKEFGYQKIQRGFGPIETGLVTYVGQDKGPTVMLRADIDALPVKECTGLSYASSCDGVMHACGHDAHAAVMLAVAKILKRHEKELPGRVKILFQPAEETRVKHFEKPLSGAGYVVRSGALEDVDAVFGMHVWGVFDKGVVFVKEGPTMMASGRFSMTVKGKGTHGASPHLGHDPITAACHIVEAAQTIVSREVSPLEPRLITFGTIHAGTATNIVPDEATLSGTIRAAKESVVRFMGNRLGEVASKTAQAHLCEADYNLLINGPAVVNNGEMVNIVRKAATEVLGKERVSDVEMLTGSEDFREYSSQRPSALFFMGMRDEAKGVGQAQHDPKFLINEEVLPDAVAVMASIAIEYLYSIK